MSKHATFNTVRGFTLLEVMVALVVFATAALALTKSISESAISVEALEQRQFADLVAHNRLVAILREGYGNSSSGVDEMAGYKFKWQRRLVETPHPNIRRVEISVSDVANGDQLSERSAFLEK